MLKYELRFNTEGENLSELLTKNCRTKVSVIHKKTVDLRMVDPGSGRIDRFDNVMGVRKTVGNRV